MTEGMDGVSPGSRLKLLRKSVPGMTQGKLANLLSVSRAAVSMWEINDSEPNLRTLVEIANVFGVTADHILGVATDPDPPPADEPPGPAQSRLLRLYDAASPEDKAVVDLLLGKYDT